MKNKVSVIMGVHNQRDKKALKQALDSILNQTMKEFEFIIYDDGSGQEEAEYLRKLTKKDGRIRLLRGQRKQGLAHGLNQCLKVAKGNYIARMDADDISAPERLRLQMEFLETHPDISYVGCAAVLFDEGGTWGCRRMKEKPVEKDFLGFSPYVHPTVMFRGNVLKKCGGYLESKDTLRCEDYELFMRLRHMGYDGYNLELPLFYYRENREWYDKRTFAQRLAEMKIRYHGFKKLGILNIKNWIYVVKPVAMLALPKTLCQKLRRKRMA